MTCPGRSLISLAENPYYCITSGAEYGTHTLSFNAVSPVESRETDSRCRSQENLPGEYVCLRYRTSTTVAHELNTDPRIPGLLQAEFAGPGETPIDPAT